MDPQRWLTIFQTLEIVAIVVALIAAIGANLFSSKVDQQKDAKIDELETKTKQASQGRAVTYAPNGAKTLSEGVGSLRFFDDNPEVQVYQQMDDLVKQQDFPALLALAEAQITKTPTWLTPYLMKGFALARLGSRDEAVEVLQFVRREAPYDPFYQQAAEWLKVLGAEPQ